MRNMSFARKNIKLVGAYEAVEVFFQDARNVKKSFKNIAEEHKDKI